MGNIYESDESAATNANGSTSATQAPAPKTSSAGKPAISGSSEAPAPKSAGAADQRDAAQQVLDPQDADLQDADVDVLTKAAESYVAAIYGTLQLAQQKAFDALKQPPIQDESQALAILAAIAETLAELVADYVTDGMFSVAKRVFGPALKHATNERVTEVLHNAADEVGKKTGRAIGARVEGAGEHESQKAEGDDASEPLVRVNPAGKTLVDEFQARQEIMLAQKRANADIVTATVVSAGRHDRKKLLKFASELNERKLGNIASWYERQIAVQWLNFSALVAAGGKIDKVEPNAGARDRHDPRMIPDGVIDIDIAIPSQIWGTQGLKLKSMKLRTSSPGAVRILHNAPMPLLDVGVLRRVSFTGNEGKLSDSTPLTIYPDGSALPATADFYLKAIGKLTPVDSRGGGMDSTFSQQQRRQANKADGATRAAPPMSTEQLIAPPANETNDGASALRGADLLQSWLAALDTGAIT